MLNGKTPQCELCGGPWHLTPTWIDTLDHDCPGQEASDDVKAEWQRMFINWDPLAPKLRYQPKHGEQVDKHGLIYDAVTGKWTGKAIPEGTVPPNWRWHDGQWHTDEVDAYIPKRHLLVR